MLDSDKENRVMKILQLSSLFNSSRSAHDEPRDICVVMTFGTWKTKSIFERRNERDIIVRHFATRIQLYEFRCVSGRWLSVLEWIQANNRNCKSTTQNLHREKWYGATNWPSGVIDSPEPDMAYIFVIFLAAKTHAFQFYFSRNFSKLWPATQMSHSFVYSYFFSAICGPAYDAINIVAQTDHRYSYFSKIYNFSGGYWPN